MTSAVEINFFNKYLLKGQPQTHLKFSLGFETVEGRCAFRQGNIQFFNVGTPEDYVNEALRCQTEFVVNNLKFLEIAVPIQQDFKCRIPGGNYAVFLAATGAKA